MFQTTNQMFWEQKHSKTLQTTATPGVHCLIISLPESFCAAPYTPMPDPRAQGIPLPMARQCVRLRPPSWMGNCLPLER